MFHKGFFDTLVNIRHSLCFIYIALSDLELDKGTTHLMLLSIITAYE